MIVRWSKPEMPVRTWIKLISILLDSKYELKDQLTAEYDIMQVIYY